MLMASNCLHTDFPPLALRMEVWVCTPCHCFNARYRYWNLIAKSRTLSDMGTFGRTVYNKGTAKAEHAVLLLCMGIGVAGTTQHFYLVGLDRIFVFATNDYCMSEPHWVTWFYEPIYHYSSRLWIINTRDSNCQQIFASNRYADCRKVIMMGSKHIV